MVSATPISAFADEVLAWLASVDPALFQDAHVPAAAHGMGALRDRAPALQSWLDAHPEVDPHVRFAFDALVASFPEPSSVGGRFPWLEVREQIAPLYDAYAQAVLATGARARHLHPTNLLRSAVHLASGLGVVAAFVWLFTPSSAFWTATAFVVWAWSLEGARRVSERVNAWCMVVFGPIARDHERWKVNSATWYGTALWVLAVTAFGPAGVLGLLALAVGDPVAGLVGRRFGRTRLWGGKSLEGSLAFAVAASVAGFAYLRVFEPGLAGLPGLLALAALCGVAGAVVELLSIRWEDNFTIPVFTAWIGQAGLMVVV